MFQHSGLQHWPFNSVCPVTSTPDAALHTRPSSSKGPEIYPRTPEPHPLKERAGPGDSQLWGLQRHSPSFISGLLGKSHFAILTIHPSGQPDGSSLRCFMDFMPLSPIRV